MVRDSTMVEAKPRLARHQAVESPEIPPPMMTTPGMAKELRLACETACATRTSHMFAGVGQAVPPAWPCSQLVFPDHLYHGFYVVHRRLRQNAVAQVEDVAGPRAGALKQLMHLGPQLGQRREQRHRIQIALDRRPVADLHPRLI